MATQLSPQALREARQKRLANAQKPTETIAPKPVETKATTEAKPGVPAKETQKPEQVRELTARVADPGKISEKSNISLAGPYESNTDNPHWVVFADGEPLAKIALADQDNSEKIRKIFATDEYARSFIDTAKKVPITNLLVHTKARPYIASVKATEAFAAIDAKYKEDAKQEFQRRASLYRDDLRTMVALVVEAQRKNFLTNNPLKNAFFKQLKSAGILDPTPLIEAAFVEASVPHFEEVIAQAQKWMDYTPESLADIKQSITEMPVRDVQAIKVPVGTRVAGSRPMVPSAAGNIPVAPSGASEIHVAEATDKDQAKRTFNFRGRMHKGQMVRNG